MKKAFVFAGLAAAALSFAGCNKEADVKGLDAIPCELILSNAVTRTVNGGLSTAWVENDELNVFYAPAGSEEYSENTKFVVDDPETNHATGTAELVASAYDWYLLYPYDSHIKTPANTSEGYLTIGSRSNGVQTQNGPDNMAHLAGKNLPVYGIAKNVATDKVPVIAMKQVTSVVAVNLTNDTDKSLSVSTVSFTAPEDIVGTYYIDFSGDELSFKDSGSGYVSATASLSVSGGQTIAAGSSAKFYIAVKPFAAKAGDELKLTVLADQGEVEKTVTLPQACTFTSGSIKTLNISYTAPAVVPTITVADINAAITSTSKSNPDSFTGQLTGAVVSFVSGSNAFIQDETGGILLYQSGHGLEAGDVLSGIVSGTGYVYNGLKEMVSLTGFDKAGGEVPEAASLSLEQLLADYDAYVSVRVKVTGVTVPTAFSSRNTTMTDGDASLALRDQKNGLTITPGAYDIVGYPSYFNAAQFGVWTQDDIIPVASDEKFFGVSQNQFDVLADATSVQVSVTGNVDWTVEPSDGITSVEPAEGSGEGTVTITFPANTDTENTKEYSAFIRTAEPSLVEAGTEEFEITITQAKADASGGHTATIDFSEQGYENAQEVVSATAGGVTFTFDKGTNNNTPKYYTTGTAVRMYGSNTLTVAAAGKTITSIVFTFGSGDGTNPITASVPAYEEPAWTGEAGSVTFTIGGTSGQRRIKAITVKYSDGGSPATASLVSIAVSGQKTEFNVGDEFTHDTAKVTATYSDNTTKDVTASATFSSPDMTTAGTKEVTVTYQEGGVTKDVKYDITVSAVDPDANTVSMTMTEYVEDHGCTVSTGNDAVMYKQLQLNESVRMSTTGEDNCGSFWNTSNTNTTKQWRLYQNKNGNVIVSVAEGCELVSVKLAFVPSNNGVLLDSEGNQVTSDATNPVSGSSVTFTVGDTAQDEDKGQIRITAVEVVYTGNGTTFPDEPSQPTETETKITMVGNASVYVGETAALNATSNVEGATITYESEDPAIATVSASGVVTGVAEGTVKVWARIAGVAGSYTSAERYCTVTVTTKPVETDGTVVFDVNYLKEHKDGEKGVISYTNSSDYGTAVPTELRVYKGKEFVVSASGDYKITSIKITCTKNGTNKEGPGCWGAGAPEGYTFQSDGPVGTWSGSASSVSFTATDNQVRIIELVVTYE